MESPYGEAAAGGGHDIDALVAAMTLDEKAALTAGVDNWHTAAIGRLGIPAVKMTDGPNGARGSTGSDHLSSTPSVCIPSGSALGATWDPEVVGAASAAVARQAREKQPVCCWRPRSTFTATRFGAVTSSVSPRTLT